MGVPETFHEVLALHGTGSADADQDIISYIISTLADEDFEFGPGGEDAFEAIGPFLVDAGLVKDEDTGRLVCKELADRLDGGGQVAAPEQPATRKLDVAVGLGQDDGKMLTDEALRQSGADVGGIGSSRQVLVVDHTAFNAKETADQRNAEKRAARAAAAAEAVARQQAEVAAEIEGSRVEVARLRAKQGGGRLGALELGPMSLPNPGGGQDLLDDASCVLVPGHRYGLLGRNGKGKSTLLKWIAARRMPGIPAATSIYYVTQDLQLSDEAQEWSPVQFVLNQDVERRLLLEELSRLEDSHEVEDLQRHTEIEARLEEIGSATAGDRARGLLQNLGFTEALMSRPMKNLSGGWRVRAALTAALFAQPDVLLLDEPTNHLSIDAVLWLSRELSSSDTWASRCVVVVSHDRCFVEDTCTDMMHISGVARRLTQHPGRYSVWAARREEQQVAWKRKAEVRAAKRDKLEAYTSHGFKYGGSSGQINMQQKMVKQMAVVDKEAEAENEALADLNEDEELPLRILAGGMLAKPAVQLQNVAFGYPKQEQLFRGAEFTVDSHSRICLLGENGNGKTTLLKIIMDVLKPTEGTLVRSPGCRIEIVNQHHADQLDFDQTPLQFMLSRFPGTRSYDHEQAIRSHLAECGVEVGQQMAPARALSGGQRTRVAMAATSYARPHVLVLDEPTNNLDLEAVVALADAVESFEGGVVVVSHDQYFVGRVAKEVWVVEGGGVQRAESFMSYKKQVLKKMRAQK